MIFYLSPDKILTLNFLQFGIIYFGGGEVKNVVSIYIKMTQTKRMDTDFSATQKSRILIYQNNPRLNGRAGVFIYPIRFIRVLKCIFNVIGITCIAGSSILYRFIFQHY